MSGTDGFGDFLVHTVLRGFHESELKGDVNHASN